jgi:hypothetical protein
MRWEFIKMYRNKLNLIKGDITKLEVDVHALMMKRIVFTQYY